MIQEGRSIQGRRMYPPPTPQDFRAVLSLDEFSQILMPQVSLATLRLNKAILQWIAPTGPNAIAQGIALGREIPRNSSP
jgi:hypothetical protein